MGDLPGCALLSLLAVLAMGGSRLRAPLGSDEGYLWYGVQQLLRGRVPLRDFRAYEPGRYLWTAAFVRLWPRRELLALRCATHAFFALALAVALLVLRRLGFDWVACGAAAFALTALSHPQHKQFEHGWALFAWAACTQWLLEPAGAAPAYAAATVGVGLFLGFNLFLYGGAALATTLLLGLAAGLLHPDRAMLVSLLSGGIAGLLPFALACAIPGFARAFWRARIGTVLARGTSNLPLPRPWPWRPAPPQFAGFDPLRRLAFRWVFLALFLGPVAAIAVVFARPAPFASLSAGILAAAALGLFLAHHAASRADASHLTQSIGPVCLLALLLSKSSGSWTVVLVLVLALWLAWPLQHAVQWRADRGAWGRRTVGGLAIDFLPAQVRILDAAAALCADAAGNRRGLFLAPLPALYAMLGRDAPAFDTFPVYRGTTPGQLRMIGELAHDDVFAAVVLDAPTDGNDALRFSRSHADVWHYLQSRFACRPRPDLGPDVFVFTRAGGVGAIAAQASTEAIPAGG